MSATAPMLSPITETQRLTHLDVLRGFALLGILIVNFYYFTHSIQAVTIGAERGLSGADAVVDWAIRWLAEGKFYPLFSMLFGVGFALMLERATTAGSRFWGAYLRRLFVLLLFGLAHGLLIWSGDILFVYAMTAFLMVLLFRRTPVQRLWKWGLAFIALPAALMLLFALLFGLASLQPGMAEQLQAELAADQAATQQRIEAAEAVHADGTWLENVSQRERDQRFLASVAVFWVPPILGFFLLGRWLLVSGRLVQPQAHDNFFRRWRAVGLGLGLPLGAAGTWLLYDAGHMPTANVAVGMVLATAATVLLSLGYLATMTLARDRLHWLAPAGRMALTNYLLQSLFWTWVFYGYGLGLWQTVPRSLQPLLAVIFFALQVVASHWWLRHFRYGPAEWLWRSLTYLKLQPMRRKTDSHPA